MAIQFHNGVILFVSGQIALHEDCCCAPCPCCKNTLPNVLIEISGVADQDCTDCEELNGIYEIESTHQQPWPYCPWGYSFPSAHPCGAPVGDITISMYLFCDEEHGYGILVSLTTAHGSPLYHYYGVTYCLALTEEDFPVDCEAFTDLDIPFSAEWADFPYDPDICNASSSSCALTTA